MDFEEFLKNFGMYIIDAKHIKRVNKCETPNKSNLFINISINLFNAISLMAIKNLCKVYLTHKLFTNIFIKPYKEY